MQFPTKWRAGVIGLALSFYLLIELLAQFPNFVEDYYSNGLYSVLAALISNLTGWIPFSITELAFWLILLIGIPLIIQRIRKKRMPLTRVLLNLTATAAVIYIWFYLLWGLNYLRPPLRTRLQLDNVSLQVDAFDSTLVQLIQRANELNHGYDIQNIADLATAIDSTYKQVLIKLGLKSRPVPTQAKHFVVNALLNKTTTSGWFSPFFHEVHYNSDLLIFEMPFILAHEKAHHLGFTNEADANFLAHLVCINAADPLIQYSGYFGVLGYFLGSIRGEESRLEFYRNLLNEGVHLDLKAARERWESQIGWISNLTNKSYDLYLKANDVKEGIKSYSLVVGLIVRYYEQENLSRVLGKKPL
jgi:hypothetical protein